MNILDVIRNIPTKKKIIQKIVQWACEEEDKEILVEIKETIKEDTRCTKMAIMEKL